MTTPPRTVYLAGPEVFLPDAIAVIEKKAAICAEFGFKAMLPSDDHVQARSSLSPTGISREIYEANVALMTAADFGVFDLTPFRGPSADVGTTFELGLMTGVGKPVFGYTNVAGDYLARIVLKQEVSLAGQPPTWRDQDACTIENFGNADNLMLDSALALNGALMIRQDAPLPRRLEDLGAFRACLEAARAWFARHPAAAPS